VIGVLAVTLSLTRAVILSLLLVIIIKRLAGTKYIMVSVMLSFLFFFLLINAGTIVQYLLGVGDSSTVGHLESLSQFAQLSVPAILFGMPLTNSGEALLPFESGFANYTLQFGLLFTIIFYFFVYRSLKILAKSPSRLHNAIATCGVVGVVTSIVFSDVFFSFTGFSMFWLFLGMTFSSTKEERFLKIKKDVATYA
jgi:hypothetical protein